MQRREITSQIILVITAFLIAIAVWLVAKQNDFETRTLPISVIARKTPSNIETRFKPPTINVTVRYPKSRASQIIPQACIVEGYEGVDVNFAGWDDFKPTPLRLNLSNVILRNLPNTVQVTDIEPQSVTLEARLHTAPAVIEVQVEGNPAPGFELIHNPPLAEPGEILLTGSPEKLEVISKQDGGAIRLESEPVNISGKNESYFQKLKVPLPQGLEYVNQSRTRLQVDPELTVETHVVIGEKTQRKTFQKVPIIIKPFSENLRTIYNPMEADVTVEAPISVVRQLSNNSFVFQPRLPIDEKEGYEADIAIDVKFSDTVSPTLREKTVIQSFSPQVIHIKILAKEQKDGQENKTEPTPSDPQEEGEPPQ